MDSVTYPKSEAEARQKLRLNLNPGDIHSHKELRSNGLEILSIVSFGNSES